MQILSSAVVDSTTGSDHASEAAPRGGWAESIQTATRRIAIGKRRLADPAAQRVIGERVYSGQKRH